MATDFKNMSPEQLHSLLTKEFAPGSKRSEIQKTIRQQIGAGAGGDAADNITDFIIDDMNSDQNRDNLNLGVLAEPLYVSEKTPAKQGHDRSSMHLMHMLYKSHAEKGMFNPERFTYKGNLMKLSDRI